LDKPYKFLAVGPSTRRKVRRVLNNL
jgi:hypothetical protein